ncbi:hypothetical protein [uncultured Ilyobacter sp.]|uniref:type IV pilus modification PilV family protein n=1 Tax=uncultured Ilyobacter sp. TaxID=544433 RepID=UPI0029F46E13|nr:hypothetical protein [uncultured Ilyobacter sp.]
MSNTHTRVCHPPVRHAALLLEVVVALTVMVTSMGFIGAQMVAGINMVMEAEEQTRASQMADRMMALLELDPNTITRFVMQREVDGDFGEENPGWFWRAYADEPEDQFQDEPFNFVTLQILHAPNSLDNETVESARVVRELHMIKAVPATIDLVRDFGMTSEDAEGLLANLPPEVLTESGEIDFTKLVQYLNPEDLFSMLPMVMGMMQQTGALSGITGSDASGLSELLQGGGVSPNQLEDLLGGSGGLSADNPLVELIRSQLQGQISDEELNGLINTINQAGGGGNRGNNGGQGIGDLDQQRDEANKDWRSR